MNENGKINIYFGTVTDVNDISKIFRIKVSIKGYTDTLSNDDLPWYYQFNGINYIPIVGDVVPVIIFENNFTTGFYGYKIDNLGDNPKELTDDDYNDYLEIYKRIVNDKPVNLTYKLSEGIIFENDITKIQIQVDKIEFFVSTNSITITEDKIYIGNENQEATILGDKGVEMYGKCLDEMEMIFDSYYDLMNKISTVCTNPFTAPIGTIIKSMIPVMKVKHKKLLSENREFLKTIQSEKVFIE